MARREPGVVSDRTDHQADDLSILYSFEGAARASVTAWAAAAAQATDPELRDRLVQMVQPSLRVQAEAQALIRRLGGTT